MDYLNNKSITNNTKVGKMVILPSSFGSGPRAIKQSFLDSMVLVQEFGLPDLFITFTCNGEWQEIQENLRENESSADRPDLVARVFEGKLKALLKDLTENDILGKVIAYTYVIEFQKRGFPHAHILLWLRKDCKIRNSEEVDRLVCAEIPNPKTCPKLYEIIQKHMIHGPCGSQNKKSPCMDRTLNICTKDFPKQYCPNTDYKTNGYPLYR